MSLERAKFSRPKFKTRPRPPMSMMGPSDFDSKKGLERGSSGYDGRSKQKVRLRMQYRIIQLHNRQLCSNIISALLLRNKMKTKSRPFRKWCTEFSRIPQERGPRISLPGTIMELHSIFKSLVSLTMSSFQDIQERKQSFDPFRGS